eukprot:TRINITY_DN379_c0_g1_i1.p1 TRINITY_DN379_c0_g1~~TRINITY_DN379_c0_g1_i1.p1  ORF type:complete len:213 (+),score=68.19 TRINITY_DN379_c0_g1_i1:1-639(+)
MCIRDSRKTVFASLLGWFLELCALSLPAAFRRRHAIVLVGRATDGRNENVRVGLDDGRNRLEIVVLVVERVDEIAAVLAGLNQNVPNAVGKDHTRRVAVADNHRLRRAHHRAVETLGSPRHHIAVAHVKAPRAGASAAPIACCSASFSVGSPRASSSTASSTGVADSRDARNDEWCSATYAMTRSTCTPSASVMRCADVTCGRRPVRMLISL